jgi:multiple sugar transport system permease protein
MGAAMAGTSTVVNANQAGGSAASAVRRSAASEKPPTGKKRRRRAAVVPYLFLAPFLLLFVAFIVAPLSYALYTSACSAARF